MPRHLAARLAWMLVTLVGVSLITFLLVFAGPVDPANALAGDKAQEVTISALRKKYGLDQPVYVQYANYMSHVIRGDLGDSYYFNRPVAEALLDKLLPTAEL